MAGILALWSANAPADLSDLTGECTPVMRDMVGTPCWSPDPVVPDEVALLEEAAQVAGLTVGMECWDPSEGRLATHVVVRGEAGVALLEFNDETFAAAQRGEFETIKACEAA